MVVLVMGTPSSSRATWSALTTATFFQPYLALSSSGDREELTTILPPSWRPSATLTMSSRLGSRTMTTLGVEIFSRTRICFSSTRMKATTGAPRRSGPKLGKAWAKWPSFMAALATSSAEVTPPWPPLPCNRISSIAHLVWFVLSPRHPGADRYSIFPNPRRLPSFVPLFPWTVSKVVYISCL